MCEWLTAAVKLRQRSWSESEPDDAIALVGLTGQDLLAQFQALPGRESGRLVTEAGPVFAASLLVSYLLDCVGHIDDYAPDVREDAKVANGVEVSEFRDGIQGVAGGMRPRPRCASRYRPKRADRARPR
jgi:hypothetical protein